MDLRRRLLRRLPLSALVTAAISALVIALGNPVGVTLAIGMFGFTVSLSLLLAWHLVTTRDHVERQLGTSYAQMEALFGTYAWVQTGIVPLPPLRGWAISPDLAAYLLRLVHEVGPKVILELGTGASTLMLAHYSQRAGSTRVVAVDHDPGYAEATRRLLRDHGVEAFAEVRLAPLVDTRPGNVSLSWYASTAFEDVSNIDLLVIDGPPGDIHPLVRYPALPQLKSKLSSRCILLLDDAAREGEQEILRKWKDEFPGLDVQMLNLEKGAALIQLNQK